ncbi:12425_t:CDS:1 [Racocetra persica]|uniref:12425_t:CDS:1 n=1 Tax=Racocetra persica TaxID=160502 RepID=A0ACA9RI43_9GLOM|nr:12425_t:CDS:1 [Racocetra persica]
MKEKQLPIQLETIKLSQVAIFKHNENGLPTILLAQRINPNKIYYSWYGIPGGKQERPYETFEQIAERETLEETGILIYPKKLIKIRYSYYPPKDTNRYNTINPTKIKTYIHPAYNQEPLQMEPNNHRIWNYYTKAEILDHIITIPELQLQLNTIFYTIENYQKILEIRYKQEEELDSENKEQFEKMKILEFTEKEATDFVNKSFESIQ